MDIFADKRTVMTLDAGGTNLVFSAIRGGEEIIEPVTLRSYPDDLEKCLNTILEGFTKVGEILTETPVAISFAFPGPADYKAGIIGKLPNLPAFTEGGVALGPMLEDHFKLPTFIGNDGNLFAYGQAIAGALPFINNQLRTRNIPKQYSNLIGITLGTGFGAGIVVNNSLCDGDNSSGGEIWLTRSILNPSMFAEASVGSRALQLTYAAKTSLTDRLPTPKEISEIAIGVRPGDRNAAIIAFKEMGKVIAESLCNAVTLIDGIVVIGGGMAGAYELMIDEIVSHMNGTILNLNQEEIPRLVSRVYNLENQKSFEEFFQYESKQIPVPFSNRSVAYTSEKRIGILKSRMGTSKAISIGAYALALERLTALTQPQPINV